MQARRGLGEVALAQAHFGELASGGAFHQHAGADALGVAVRSGQVDGEVGVAVGVVVAEHGGRFAVVGDEHVHLAVVVVVRAGHAASLVGVVEAQRRGPLGERAVAVGHEQARRVRLELAAAFVGVAVGVEQVRMAVVVEVREARAPAPAALAHAGVVGGVLEHARAVVAVQTVAGPVGGHLRIPDAGDEPVQVPVLVVVRHRAAHAVLVADHVGGEIGEGVAAGDVAQHLAGAEVAGEQQVRIAVVVEVREHRRERVFGFADHPIGGLGGHAVAHVRERALAFLLPQELGLPVGVAGAPMREEEVQIAVAVVVGGGHGGGGPGVFDVGGTGVRPETAEPVVEEHFDAVFLHGDEVQPTVLVHVHEVGRLVDAPRRDAGVLPLDEARAVEAEQSAAQIPPVGDVQVQPAVAIDVR